MQCSKCQTEMRIISNKPILKKGQFYNRMTLACRCKDCPDYGKEIHKDRPIEVEEVGDTE